MSTLNDLPNEEKKARTVKPTSVAKIKAAVTIGAGEKVKFFRSPTNADTVLMLDNTTNKVKLELTKEEYTRQQEVLSIV